MGSIQIKKKYSFFDQNQQLIDQKNQKDMIKTVYQLPKIRIVLNFCGGAYSKFGINQKEVHNGWNTEN